jgi:hypothetical protein
MRGGEDAVVELVRRKARSRQIGLEPCQDWLWVGAEAVVTEDHGSFDWKMQRGLVVPAPYDCGGHCRWIEPTG